MDEQQGKMEKGMEVIAKLFPHSSGGISLPADFTRYTVAHLFGDVWQGADLSLDQRSLITCVTLVALNRESEMKLHFSGAKNIGIERKIIEATITHIAHYAGWPVAVSAFRILDEVWPEG